MSCTYTEISLTRNETSVFFFLVCFRVASLTEGLTDVCVCFVKWCYSVLLHWCNAMDDFLIFTSAIQNHCPETGQCGLLMYINEMCSMVVFWSWFMIGLNCISQISETVDLHHSQMCGFVWSRNLLWGAHWPLAMVNLLAWSKAFHVKFSFCWNFFECTHSNGFRLLPCW